MTHKEKAADHIKSAFRSFAEARRHLTIWEFQDHIAKNISELGGHGFIASMGEAITAATAKPVNCNEGLFKAERKVMRGTNEQCEPKEG